MNDKKINVLVVDDDEDILMMMGDFLEIVENAHLFSVLSSKDITQATEFIESHKPEILITDITLPGGDGAMLAEKLRQSNKNSYIVIMSGWNQDTSSGKRVQNVDSYLKKPFDFDKFESIIKEAVIRINKDSTVQC